MLSVAEALERLLKTLPVTVIESAALAEAAGRVLAEDIVADIDSPRFANSSVDGFAVRVADLAGATEENPKVLNVVGDIPAGKFFEATLKGGQAVRIMTGAALPPGADAVIPVEETDAPVAHPGAALPAQVHVRRALTAGDYVRLAGQDFHVGDALLKAGSRLRAQDAALLAQLGKAHLRVHRKPRVAIFSSGDELLPVDQPLALGKIHETNSYALAALVGSCGAQPVVLGVAQDNLADVTTHLDRAVAEKADLILSSAGVSVGSFDYLRAAVTSDGAVDFWKVNMRPGRPFTFGSYRQIPYVGLPGNPASAFVGFEVFVRPALEYMGGVVGWQRRTLSGRLVEASESDGRESFLRVKVKQQKDGLDIYLTGHQGLGNLYSLVLADALMRVPAGVTNLSANSMQEIWLL